MILSLLIKNYKAYIMCGTMCQIWSPRWGENSQFSCNWSNKARWLIITPCGCVIFQWTFPLSYQLERLEVANSLWDSNRHCNLPAKSRLFPFNTAKHWLLLDLIICWHWLVTTTESDNDSMQRYLILMIVEQDLTFWTKLGIRIRWRITLLC